MSYEDIARQLGISIGKVKTDIHRGREALRQKLKMNADGEIAAGFSPAPPRSSRPTLMGCV
jgi:DNA-binding CsgD family transcriptional regulator